jgi:tRNA wybutosine-synthesizing protein 3
LVDFDEFMNNLHLLLTNKLTESKQISSGFSLNNKVKEEGLVESNLSKAGNGLKSINFKFKQEPPILHVVCKSLEDAESLLKKAQLVGFKRSGAISLSGNIVVELISTEKIEFPLLKDGNLLVREDFLRFVIQKSNENLEKGWKKVENLKNSLE